ncbi:MAG TPA: response regulator transcription factor [Treponemataceae bacterium]|nr:response regulator transcription factor [Treponemataceae bacterium]
MKDILIVEDNQELGTLIKDFLIKEGFSVVLENTAEKALDNLKKENFSLLLLDVCLPGKNGFEALEEIRKVLSLPVLMMSAQADDQSKILGMEIGADDYLAKPFSIPVLSSKIKALIRRTYNTVDEKNILESKGLKVDLSSRIVLKNGTIIKVTGKEFEILVYLMKHEGKVVNKETLFDAVWGEDCYSELSSLNVYVRWLREKIEDDPKNPALIHTIWKAGFKFG